MVARDGVEPPTPAFSGPYSITLTDSSAATCSLPTSKILDAKWTQLRGQAGRRRERYRSLAVLTHRTHGIALPVRSAVRVTAPQAGDQPQVLRSRSDVAFSTGMMLAGTNLDGPLYCSPAMHEALRGRKCDLRQCISDSAIVSYVRSYRDNECIHPQAVRQLRASIELD